MKSCEYIILTMNNKKDFEIISTYTIKEAEVDGVLINILKLSEKYLKRKIFSHVTMNLATKGYLKDNKLNDACMIDLLIQSFKIIHSKSNHFKEYDYFFSGEIELPNGEKQKIFIVENELESFTIMLPEDY